MAWKNHFYFVWPLASVWLWRFFNDGSKLMRFLAKNQYFRSKSFYLENSTMNEVLTKIGHNLNLPKKMFPERQLIRNWIRLFVIENESQILGLFDDLSSQNTSLEYVDFWQKIMVIMIYHWRNSITERWKRQSYLEGTG